MRWLGYSWAERSSAHRRCSGIRFAFAAVLGRGWRPRQPVFHEKFFRVVEGTAPYGQAESERILAVGEYPSAKQFFFTFPRRCVIINTERRWNMMKSKSKISNCFFTTLRIWASAWLAFVISIIPMYIWRWTNNESPEAALFIEYIIMSVCGLLFGFVILTLFQSREDSSERLDFKQSVITAFGSAVIYVGVWLIAYLINHNNIWIAVNGYFLGCAFGVNSENRPTFLASLLSALIFSAVYICAIILGTKIANRRKTKFLNDLKK